MLHNGPEHRHLPANEDGTLEDGVAGRLQKQRPACYMEVCLLFLVLKDAGRGKVEAPCHWGNISGKD